MIPCPDGCCANFVEHFEKPLLSVMDDYGIEMEAKSGFEMYKSGVYNDYIRTALENRKSSTNTEESLWLTTGCHTTQSVTNVEG